MAAIDVHQHLWPEDLVAALARRTSPPRLRRAGRDWILELAGEPPAPVDLREHDPAARAELVDVDGLGEAVVALSMPLGIEGLPDDDAAPLLDAHHHGILELGAPFALWAAAARPDRAAVGALLDRGARGLALPAGSVADRAGLERWRPVLAVLAERDAPLFVHPGPAPAGGAVPAWWPALTAYVAETAAAWHAFLAWGRPAHPDLRVIFALLAGLAPLHHERLRARGGPPGAVHDPRVFYDTSSYGREALDAMVRAVGVDQLVHGSDRPVTAPLAGTPLGPAAAAAMREVNPARLLGRVGVAA